MGYIEHQENSRQKRYFKLHLQYLVLKMTRHQGILRDTNDAKASLLICSIDTLYRC